MPFSALCQATSILSVEVPRYFSEIFCVDFVSDVVNWHGQTNSIAHLYLTATWLQLHALLYREKSWNETERMWTWYRLLHLAHMVHVATFGSPTETSTYTSLACERPTEYNTNTQQYGNEKPLVIARGIWKWNKRSSAKQAK